MLFQWISFLSIDYITYFLKITYFSIITYLFPIILSAYLFIANNMRLVAELTGLTLLTYFIVVLNLLRERVLMSFCY